MPVPPLPICLAAVAVLAATVLSFERPQPGPAFARPGPEVAARLLVRAGLWGLLLLGFAALAGGWPGGREAGLASVALLAFELLRSLMRLAPEEDPEAD